MSDPRRPSSEPEIIPPGVPLPRSSPHSPGWMREEPAARHYVYSARIGPVGAALATLAVGGVAVLGALFLLGAAFIGLLMVGALLGVGFVAGLLRRPSQPLR